jgi:hypothetical protein
MESALGFKTLAGSFNGLSGGSLLIRISVNDTLK